MKTKSVAKLKLIEFIKYAEMEHEYPMIVNIPVKKADDFVHRMRVELSRFRTLARDRGRVPKHFKMLYLRAESIDDNDKKCKIILMKSTSSHNVDNTVDEIFDKIAGGEMLNAE